MDITTNIMVFRETLDLCQNDVGLKESISSSISRQAIVPSDSVLSDVPVGSGETVLEVISARSIEAVGGLEGRTCVLNFANFIRPGGGVKIGSRAQEESICRITTLYPCISSDVPVEMFYRPHKGTSPLANDDLIYTPDVTVFREDSDDMAILPQDSRYNVDIITCAAPDMRFVAIKEDDAFRLFERRFNRILDVAAIHGVDNLVLGAFGCGAFENDPEIVSLAAKRSVESHLGLFKRIVFAIPMDRNGNFSVFKRVLCPQEVSEE